MMQVAPLWQRKNQKEQRDTTAVAYLPEGILYLALNRNIAGIERNVMVSLDDVQHRHYVPPVLQSFYDVSAKKPASTDDDVVFLLQCRHF